MEVFSEEAIQGPIIKAVEELGYSSLRSQQELAVKQFVCGNDVFVCLPTGSEKSLCYSILPSVFDYLSVLHMKYTVTADRSQLIAFHLHLETWLFSPDVYLT